jgi:endonuclease-3
LKDKRLILISINENMKNIKIEYEMINDMRKNTNTPVDTMGCHLFENDFETLVAALFSSQTKDIITYPAVQRLKEKGLSVDSILEIDLEELSNIIKPVGFYNKKAKTVKEISKILKDKYNSKIPKSYTDLIKLPGIGPKMAYLILNIIDDQPHGICVDTHVHRIVNRIGWTNTKTPEATRMALQQVIDKNNWIAINPLLVGFGQSVCKARKPNCSDCILNNRCPYYQNHIKNKIGQKIEF